MARSRIKCPEVQCLSGALCSHHDCNISLESLEIVTVTAKIIAIKVNKYSICVPERHNRRVFFPLASSNHVFQEKHNCCGGRRGGYAFLDSSADRHAHSKIQGHRSLVRSRKNWTLPGIRSSSSPTANSISITLPPCGW